MRRRIASTPPAAAGAAAWEQWTVAVAFAAAVALALAGRAATTAGPGDGVTPPGAVAAILLNAAPIAVALVLAGLAARPSAADFGLRPAPPARAVGLSLAAWVGVTALTAVWIGALGLDGEDGQALLERVGTDTALSVLVLVAVTTILGPLGEELLFRGYIFRALRNRHGMWPAAVATGVLFGAMHVGWVPLALIVPSVVFGIWMCFLYVWTGSLYPCIAVHAFGNALPLAVHLEWTWQLPLLVVGAPLAAVVLARLLALGLRTRPRT